MDKTTLLKAAETISTPRCPDCKASTKPAGDNFKCPKCGASVSGAGKLLSRKDFLFPEFAYRQPLLHKSGNPTFYIYVGKDRYGKVEQVARKWRAVSERGLGVFNGGSSAEEAAKELLKAVYPDELMKDYDPANQVFSLDKELSSDSDWGGGGSVAPYTGAQPETPEAKRKRLKMVAKGFPVFDENKHPRASGKFAPKGTPPGTGPLTDRLAARQNAGHVIGLAAQTLSRSSNPTEHLEAAKAHLSAASVAHAAGKYPEAITHLSHAQNSIQRHIDKAGEGGEAEPAGHALSFVQNAHRQLYDPHWTYGGKSLRKSIMEKLGKGAGDSDELNPPVQSKGMAPSDDVRAIALNPEIPAQVTSFNAQHFMPAAQNAKFLALVIGPQSLDYAHLENISNALGKSDLFEAARQFRMLSKSSQDHRGFKTVKDALLKHGLESQHVPYNQHHQEVSWANLLHKGFDPTENLLSKVAGNPGNTTNHPTGPRTGHTPKTEKPKHQGRLAVQVGGGKGPITLYVHPETMKRARGGEMPDANLLQKRLDEATKLYTPVAELLKQGIGPGHPAHTINQHIGGNTARAAEYMRRAAVENDKVLQAALLHRTAQILNHVHTVMHPAKQSAMKMRVKP